MKTLIPVLSLTVALSYGCATKTETGALVGAGTGAAVGAGIGAAVGGGEGALIGGAVGAVAGGITGGVIGNYMDRQEKELKETVTSAKIERFGDELIVRFDSGLLFDVGQSSLKPASQTDLTDFATILKKYKDTNVLIEGHTDNTGARDLNLRLSQARSESVGHFLFGKGVAKTRMSMVGMAYDRPIASNETPEGRQLNRRVEVKITPTAELKKKYPEQKS